MKENWVNYFIDYFDRSFSCSFNKMQVFMRMNVSDFLLK